jgi:hypothetical protein
MDFNLVGVQTERDADNLRRGLLQELGAIPQKSDVLDVDGKSTCVKSFPIGIGAFRTGCTGIAAPRIGHLGGIMMSAETWSMASEG